MDVRCAIALRSYGSHVAVDVRCAIALRSCGLHVVVNGRCTIALRSYGVDVAVNVCREIDAEQLLGAAAVKPRSQCLDTAICLHLSEAGPCSVCAPVLEG